ncbi:MAG: tetratricopeptide repeat protein [Hyphomicrobiaceae bacterium]
MLQDQWGNDLSTTSRDAVAAYDSAIFDFLEYRLTLGDRVKAILAADPECLMGLCFRGYMLMQFGSNAVLGKVREVLEPLEARAGNGTPREQLHVKALRAWMEGRVREARGHWERIAISHPGDLLALRLHHFMSFWQGDRQGLRDVPAGAVAAADEAMPGYGFLLSMLSFGTEECGDYARAEAFGRQAVSLNDNDLWGIHAVAHVLEMQCRHQDGIAFLDQPFGTWSDRNPFKDHVWWHTALFALELGEFERVLDIYDREVKVNEVGFYLDVQNAVSMLMRLKLSGVDVGDRWDLLADLAASRKGDHVMPFTDAHFLMALIGADRRTEADDYRRSLVTFASDNDDDAANVTRQIGIPLANALSAYGAGRNAEAADTLYTIRHDLAPLGGSHAQQDVFHQILIDAATKSGKTDMARSLLRERSIVRPGTTWAEKRLAALG